MAVTFISATQGNQSTSYSVDAGSATDRFLKVIINGGTTDNVLGVTFNTVALTQQAKIQIGSGRWNYLYTLANPDAGSHTLAISISGGDVSGSYATIYSGVLQTGQPTGAQTASGNGTAAAVTCTATDNNSKVIGGSASAAGGPTAGSGTTLNAQDTVLADADVTAAVAASATGTININQTSSQWVAYGVVVEPSLQVLTMTADVGVFTLTGVAVGLSHVRTLIAEVGNFILSGIGVSFRIKEGWRNTSKSSAPTFSNQSKSSAPSFTNQSKNSATWINQDKT